jgi:hypothetical protein
MEQSIAVDGRGSADLDGQYAYFFSGGGIFAIPATNSPWGIVKLTHALPAGFLTGGLLASLSYSKAWGD